MSEKNVIFQNQSELPPSAMVDDTTNILNIPYTVCELIVAFIAVIGNAMVIIVFLREKKLRRRTNYYIVSLAIADLLVGLLGVPFAILASIGLPTNTSICLFTISLLVVLCTISIFCLVAVSIDRYWAILYPLAYSKNVRTKTAVLIITFCWVFGCIIGFLPSFGWNAATNEHQLCLFEGVMNYDYLLFLYFGTIITPAVLMIAFYVHIYTVVIKQVSQIVTLDQIGGGGGGSNSSRKASISKNNTPRSSIPTKPHSGTMLRVLGAARKREVKAAQNLSIIVLFFLICWIPLHTINCVNAFCQTCSIPELTYFCIILSHLNSAVNPLLYAYHLKDFRAALKILIMKLLGKEIPPQDPSYKFSCASQHRLPSIFEKRTSLQPRVYIDSPIWKRQQEMQKRNSLLHSPVAGSFDGVHNTVSAIAAIGCGATNFHKNNRIRTASGDYEMWNIMEVPSVTEDCLHHTNHENKRNSLRSIKDTQSNSSINKLENISSETVIDQSEYFERDFTYVDADDNENNNALDGDRHNGDDEEDLDKQLQQQEQQPLFTVELQNHKQCMAESSSSTHNLFLTELPYCTGETVTNNYFDADTMNSEFDNLHERSLSLNINNNNNNNLNNNNNNNNNNIEQLNGYTNYKEIKIIKMDNFKCAPPNISKSATNFNLNNSNNSNNNTKNNNNCCDLGVNKTSPLRIVSNLLLFTTTTTTTTTTDQNNTNLLENKNNATNRIRYRSRSRSDS